MSSEGVVLMLRLAWAPREINSEVGTIATEMRLVEMRKEGGEFAILWSLVKINVWEVDQQRG